MDLVVQFFSSVFYLRITSARFTSVIIIVLLSSIAQIFCTNFAELWSHCSYLHWNCMQGESRRKFKLFDGFFLWYLCSSFALNIWNDCRLRFFDLIHTVLYQNFVSTALFATFFYYSTFGTTMSLHYIVTGTRLVVTASNFAQVRDSVRQVLSTRSSESSSVNI